MWYHISYDIKDGDDTDYEDLFKQIRKFPAYSHILKSSWVVKSSKDASTIRDDLVDSTDEDLDIMVTAMGSGDAARLKNSKIRYLVNNLGWKSSKL